MEEAEELKEEGSAEMARAEQLPGVDKLRLVEPHDERLGAGTELASPAAAAAPLQMRQPRAAADDDDAAHVWALLRGSAAERAAPAVSSRLLGLYTELHSRRTESQGQQIRPLSAGDARAKPLAGAHQQYWSNVEKIATRLEILPDPEARAAFAPQAARLRALCALNQRAEAAEVVLRAAEAGLLVESKAYRQKLRQIEDVCRERAAAAAAADGDDGALIALLLQILSSKQDDATGLSFDENDFDDAGLPKTS